MLGYGPPQNIIIIFMKKFYLTILFALGLLTVSAQDNSRIATCDLNALETAHYMAPGWNLGNTMEAGSNANNFTNNGGLNSETSWQATKTTQEIIDFVKASGFKSVRIPCAWVMGHITDKDNMTIDDAWLNRVKEIVDYCINDGLFVVLNDHWDGGWLEYDGFTTGADVNTKKEQLRKLWTNIATAFKDYDGHLIFAGLNEPGVGGASPEAKGSKLGTYDLTKRLLEYEQVFIDAVRATGGNNVNRVLVVQGPNTNASDTYKYYDAGKLVDAADKRLMVEVHHYDPYQFCGMTEDADWGNVWYYWYGHAPKRATKRTAPASQQTAIQTNFNNLKSKFVEKGYPVIIGEYGANARTLTTAQGNQQKHNESRQYWYNFTTEYAMEAGCVPFAWDINNPSMYLIDRNNLVVKDQYDVDGITEGVAAAQTDFNTIYPEPSSTSGINSITAPQKAGKVYNISGRIVKTNVKNFNDVDLPAGIYIYNGRKYIK